MGNLLQTKLACKQAEKVWDIPIYSYSRKGRQRKAASSQTKEINIYIQVISRHILDEL